MKGVHGELFNFEGVEVIEGSGLFIDMHCITFIEDTDEHFGA